jgi:hypothetical protein
MAKVKDVEVIGTEAQEGLGSPYILMLIQNSLANHFMWNYLIGLGRE